ncbi:MAG: mannosyl-3-phosphoglycerate phosphatase, partial [Gemmatimonadetes bacterium]|nr:mannosyl-3-phosphoglycerate phosphatase [Gemmatimonadota bacterium]NIR79112.1 mannosyl-3-phosphoglycerate phosphatase [Gemmatimonadota bacterium]NIT87765.1 mannosyl-3-phosphoglycerate phosphatase [Gemmatimonadota bacterium]NIU31628.1 mannosyl-3-phosphoglycerate phosphatase [Gemmatimonadota bacterium]NIU36255.1 mannosyl-3-phosphoglycerate phosphatase [Gemmatimonadota bacterium]
LMEATGLPEAQAMRARSRDFSETIHLDAGPDAWDALSAALEERGCDLQGSGPMGTVVDTGTDKGRGVRVVRELFRRSLGEEVEAVALGDGASDAPMFDAVDRAYLVERKGGGWAEIDLPGLERVEGVGPHGWEPVVRELLDEPVRRSRPRAPR